MSCNQRAKTLASTFPRSHASRALLPPPPPAALPQPEYVLTYSAMTQICTFAKSKVADAYLPPSQRRPIRVAVGATMRTLHDHDMAVAEQGAAVAALKKDKSASQEAIDGAVAELLRRKADLKAALEEALAAAQASGDIAQAATLQEKITAVAPKGGKKKAADKPKAAAPPKTPPKKDVAPKPAKPAPAAAAPKSAAPKPAAAPAAPSAMPEGVGLVLFLPSGRTMEACAKLQRRFRLVGLKQLALPAGLGAPPSSATAAPMVLATAWDLSCIDGPPSRAEAALRLLVGTPGAALPGSILADYGRESVLGPFAAPLELALCFAPAELCVERPRPPAAASGPAAGQGVRPSALPPPPAGGKAPAAAGAPGAAAAARLSTARADDLLSLRVARASGGPAGTPVRLEIGRAASAARQLVAVSLQPPKGADGWVRFAAAGAGGLR